MFTDIRSTQFSVKARTRAQGFKKLCSKIPFSEYHRQHLLSPKNSVLFFKVYSAIHLSQKGIFHLTNGLTKNLTSHFLPLYLQVATAVKARKKPHQPHTQIPVPKTKYFGACELYLDMVTKQK